MCMWKALKICTYFRRMNSMKTIKTLSVSIYIQYNLLFHINWISQFSHLSNNSPCSTWERGNQSRCTRSNERIPLLAKRPPTKPVWLDRQTTRREEINHQSTTEKHRDHYKNPFHVHRQTIMTNFCTRKVFMGKLKPNFIWTKHQENTLSSSSNISKSIFHLVANTFY